MGSKDEKNARLNQRRKLLAEQYKSEFTFMRIIEGIAKRSASDLDSKIDNLMPLLSDKNFLIQAMGTVSKRRGALTEGPPTDKQTADEASLAIVEKLSETLKSGTFRFQPAKRIYMDKSGTALAPRESMKQLTDLHKKGSVSMAQVKQAKVRPIRISSFNDKIVQECIRTILNAIYEPEFENLNMNFGFRAKYGCHDAIRQIQSRKEMLYAIEGDVSGAFDNVDHTLFMNVLRRRIVDEDFLRLITGGMKCGIIFKRYRQDSDLGTPQGSVVSPLLYNIYFHEFDRYIAGEFIREVDEINRIESRTDGPSNKLYNMVSVRRSRLGIAKQVKSLNETYKEEGFGPEFDSKLARLKIDKKKYEDYGVIQKKTPSLAKSRQTIRFSYTRYADDWIFLTNASRERVEEWKGKFANWITENLRLSLNLEKTKVTDFRAGGIARFLGFQLSRATKKRILRVGVKKSFSTDLARRSKKLVSTIPVEERKRDHKQRTTNPTLIVAWDRDRILNRLENRGFIRKYGNTYRGRSKLPWTTLEEPEIVERYNYIIMGYLQYYVPVLDYSTDIQFLHYLLTYSFYHTIAQKNNMIISKAIDKYGNGKVATYKKRIERFSKTGEKVVEEKDATASLYDWEAVLKIIRDIKRATIQKLTGKSKDPGSPPLNVAVNNICDVKITWRTKYKLSQHCAICGSQENVEYHHVKHIKVGKVTGFTQVLKQLNRKQIPCCRECHRKIHNGQYDGMSLNQLYDEELVII